MEKAKTVPSGVVIVLGMHRTGTSLVASLLEALGVSMGDDLIGPSPSNPYGHYEDKNFVYLNIEMLNAMGFRWDYPPEHYDWFTGLLPSFFERAESMLIEKSKSDLWGWKDPRTALTLPVYARYLYTLCPRNGGIKYVLTHRRRQSVINSLRRRNGDGAWNTICDRYERFIGHYLKALSASHTYSVTFEDAVDHGKAEGVVKGLADFIGVSHERVSPALDRIDFRR